MNALHWIVLALVAFGASALVGSSIALGVAAALLAALAFGLLTSRPVAAQLTADRQVDVAMIESGGSVGVRLQVSAGGAFFLRWLLVRDEVPRTVATDAPTGRLAIGGSGLAVDLRYRATFPRRGVYALGPVEAQHGDILSLRTARQTLARTDLVTVYPKVVLVPEFSLPSARPLGERHTRLRSFEDPTRPAGCRAYERGDPIKRIHWPASARTGTLVSKVYDGSSAPLYVVIPNLYQADWTTEDRFELGCVAAASLVASLARGRDEVGLLGRTMLKPDTGELHLERCLAALAAVEPEERPFFERLLAARVELPWRATLVVVTEGLDEHSAAALDMMRRSGCAVAAVVIGDALETQRAIGRLAALGGSVARIEREEDLGQTRFIGIGR